MLRTVLALLAAIFVVPPAVAGEIPRFDVKGYCNSVADISGGSSMIYNGCIDMEQQAYNALKSSWAGLPDRQQKYCHEVAEISGGSYMILKGCIDMESDAAGAPSTFEY